MNWKGKRAYQGRQTRPPGGAYGLKGITSAVTSAITPYIALNVNRTWFLTLLLKCGGFL
jgi:hypothetical protein